MTDAQVGGKLSNTIEHRVIKFDKTLNNVSHRTQDNKILLCEVFVHKAPAVVLAGGQSRDAPVINPAIDLIKNSMRLWVGLNRGEYALRFEN